ncbi:MAG: hypothetical protein AMXMBFR64_02770 [Myxococcales bacterium]
MTRPRPWLLTVLVAALSTAACDDGETAGGGGFGGDVAIQPSDTGGGGGMDAPGTDVSGGGYVVNAQAMQIQSGGRTIHIRRYVPQGCDATTPCPGVVLVPDGILGGDEFFGDDAPELLAGAAQVIVARYNPPARGTGTTKSDGVEDYNGKAGQDALKDVLLALDKSQDTTDKIGVVSFGFGLSAASASLASYQPTNLKFVDWLIDVEGPVNRCYITQAASDADAGITGDGVGVTDSKCDFDKFGLTRDEAFPTSLPQGAPKSLICSKGAFPINLTGKDCTEDLWWADREPKKFLSKLQGAYLRLQMKYDHVQPSRAGALVGVYYAIQSSALAWKQLNDVEANKPVHTWGDATCVQAGCYLSSDLGNALAFGTCQGTSCDGDDNPFKAVMPGYKAMTLAVFAEKVLPKYVARLNGL